MTYNKEKSNMRLKVFVSGCYDILHAGHIQFFKEAKEYGMKSLPKLQIGEVQKVDLIVSFCSEDNLTVYKQRVASMPDDNKKILLESIRYVDRAHKGSDDGGIWDFVPAFLLEQPDILVVTEDDKHAEEKSKFCEEHNCRFVVLPKTPPMATQTSTSKIISNIKNS